MLQKKYVEKIKVHFAFGKVFPKIVPFKRWCKNIWCSQAGHRWQYGACALHTG